MAAEEITLDAEIQKALSTRKDEIIKGLVEGAVSSLQRDLGWKVAHATEQHIDSFIKQEVLPEVQKRLQSRKAEIIDAMLKGIDTALEQAGKTLVSKAAKNLGESWNLKKLTEAMFG